MARTVEQLFASTARKIGTVWFRGQFESSGNTTSSGVDNTLATYPSNRFAGRHLYIDSGSPTQRNLIIREFAQATNTLTFYPTLGAAPDSLTFYIMPFARDDIHDAITRAAVILHDRGLLVSNYQSFELVSGSPLFNGGWEYWSSTAPQGWTNSGLTMSQSEDEDTGGNLVGLKVTAGTGSLTLADEWKTFLDDFRGGTLRFYAQVKTASASTARISLNVDNSENYSSYHTGGGGWEVLKTDVITIANDSLIAPKLLVDADNNVAVGRVWVEGTGPKVNYYPFSGDKFTQVDSVKLTAADAYGSNKVLPRQYGSLEKLPFTDMTYRRTGTTDEYMQRGMLYIPGRANGKTVPSGRVMLLEGSGPVDIPTSDSGTVDIDLTEEEMLTMQAAVILATEHAGGGDERSRQNLLTRAGQLQGDLESLASGYNRAKRRAPSLRMVR